MQLNSRRQSDGVVVGRLSCCTFVLHHRRWARTAVVSIPNVLVDRLAGCEDCSCLGWRECQYGPLLRMPAE
jgi:hypothetical protein